MREEMVKIEEEKDEQLIVSGMLKFICLRFCRMWIPKSPAWSKMSRMNFFATILNRLQFEWTYTTLLSIKYMTCGLTKGVLVNIHRSKEGITINIQ